jgi:hypothetical protein
MEKCYYISHNDLEAVKNLDCRRVYIGHETCEGRLPAFHEMKPVLKLMKNLGINLTLQIPFLSEAGLLKTKNLIKKIRDEVSGFEVAASDWGLLHWLSDCRIAIPIAGRLLTGQNTDPRLQQLYPENDLKLHLSSSTIMKKKVIAFLNKSGINRFEISKLSFNPHLPENNSSKFSLHIPYTPVSVMRWCIRQDLNFNFPDKNCSNSICQGTVQEWKTNFDKYNFVRIDNAIYYKYNHTETIQHPSVDRIVINRTIN